MKRGLLLILLLIFGMDSRAEGAADLSPAEKAKLAKQVKGIFENKCAKCHGPAGVRESKKAKGEFDFVLKLGKLASDPEKIVRGNPNESQLFISVDDEIMPDEQAGEDPLPASEKEIIRRWILAGAPTQKGKDPAAKYHCPATRKYDFETAYTPEQLKRGQFSTRVEELSEGVFLSRCSFSLIAGKVTCDRTKVDRVEFDQNVKIKKFYVFRSQFNFQIFSDLSSLEDNGRGSVQYGKCKFMSP